MSFLKSYEEEVVEYYGGKGFISDRYNPAPERVLEVIRLSLVNHVMINEVIWSCLQKADPRIRRETCSRVCKYGWEYDKDTEKLKEVFQSLLSLTKPIDWESYL